jgi:adenylate cyclase
MIQTPLKQPSKNLPSPVFLLRATNLKIMLVTMVANLAGAILTFLYFSVIAPLPTQSSPVQTINASQWQNFVGLMVFLLALGTIWIYFNFKQLRTWLQQAVPNQPAPAHIRQQALNYVPQSILVTALMWLIATIYQLTLVYFDHVPLTNMIHVFLGVMGVGGLLTTALLYFVVDLLWRPVIPLFFPDGKLSEIRAWRLSILGRLLLVFLLVGILPPAILVILSLQRAEELLGSANPSLVLENLVILEMFMLGISFIVSIGLAFFTTRSIVFPLRLIQEAMARVGQNDLSAQVSVTTNDELGFVGERFNAMTTGLRQGEMLRTLLNLYVSPEVAHQAITEGAKLGGETVECTILFSDLRDFTGLAERLSAKELIALINRYMTVMVGTVIEHGGIVNKFGGDSLLAVFGTPLNPNTDHAARAIHTALDMLRALEEFNRMQSTRQSPTLQLGIGIATGSVVAGNVGGKERIEYTVLGDTVNLASRLQDKTKELDYPILISEETFHTASQTIAVKAELLEPITVKGKQHPINIYAL